jgi:hypothetical protein
LTLASTIPDVDVHLEWSLKDETIMEERGDFDAVIVDSLFCWLTTLDTVAPAFPLIDGQTKTTSFKEESEHNSSVGNVYMLVVLPWVIEILTLCSDRPKIVHAARSFIRSVPYSLFSFQYSYMCLFLFCRSLKLSDVVGNFVNTLKMSGQLQSKCAYLEEEVNQILNYN